MEEKYKIHAIYILGILLAIIVILVTVRWAEIPALAQYISFGLTFASLLLAILAIAYSVYSNSLFSQNISSLNTASHDISNAANDISQATKNLGQKIDVIPSSIERVEGKVIETNVLLRQFSENQTTQPLNDEEIRAASEVADIYMDRLSLGAVLFIYVCSISFTKKLPFDLKNLCSSLEIITGDFAVGILLATRAAGLMDYTLLGDIHNIIELNEKLVIETRSKLDKQLNESFDLVTYDVTESHKTDIINEVNKIEQYFSVDSFNQTAT